MFVNLKFIFWNGNCGVVTILKVNRVIFLLSSISFLRDHSSSNAWKLFQFIIFFNITDRNQLNFIKFSIIQLKQFSLHEANLWDRMQLRKKCKRPVHYYQSLHPRVREEKRYHQNAITILVQYLICVYAEPYIRYWT